MTMLRKPLTAVAPLVLISLLAAGCTDDAKPSATPSASATEKPTATEPPQGENEEEQGKRAKAALETVSLDDPEFVESGLERVRKASTTSPRSRRARHTRSLWPASARGT